MLEETGHPSRDGANGAAGKGMPTRFRALFTLPPAGASSGDSPHHPPAYAGRRVDDVVRGCAVEVGSTASSGSGGTVPLALLHAWVRRGVLRVVSGAPQQPAIPRSSVLRHRLRPGDVIAVHDSIADGIAWRPGARFGCGGDGRGLDAPPPAWLAGAHRWSNESLLVISKPAGVATQGGSGLPDRQVVDTWLPALHAACPPRVGAPAVSDTALRLVHRLDRDVGGLLLLARGRAAAEACRAALSTRDGSIHKTYVAVVPARLPPGVPTSGVIRAPIADGRDGAPGRDGDAQDALSRYAVYVPPGTLAAASSTVLLLEPVTGRKHQLRQHVVALFRATAAIAGDRKYAAGGARAAGNHLLLHAAHMRLAPGFIGDRAGGRCIDVFDTLPAAFRPHIGTAARSAGGGAAVDVAGSELSLRAAILAFTAGPAGRGEAMREANRYR